MERINYGKQVMLSIDGKLVIDFEIVRPTHLFKQEYLLTILLRHNRL